MSKVGSDEEPRWDNLLATMGQKYHRYSVYLLYWYSVYLLCWYWDNLLATMGQKYHRYSVYLLYW